MEFHNTCTSDGTTEDIVGMHFSFCTLQWYLAAQTKIKTL